MDPATYEHLRNKTLLFFIEKLLDPSHGNNNNNDSTRYTNKRTLHDLSCQFGSKGFTKEMRQIAGGSQSGLKKFLQTYPSIFKIEGDMVSYNVNSTALQTSQTTTVGDMELEDNPEASSSSSTVVSSIDNEAVEYFRERLMQYGIGIWVPVKSLLGHRSQAPPHIRHVSGQHIKEFTTFLSKYPSTFILNAQDEVLLKEFENYYNENKDAPGGSFDSTKQTTLNSVIEKKRIVELIEFYGNCLVERGPMLVEQLFCAGDLKYDQHHDSGVLWEYFKCPNDLATFFKMYPQCFQVHSNLVTFSDTYKVGLEYLKRQTGGILIPSTQPPQPPKLTPQPKKQEPTTKQPKPTIQPPLAKQQPEPQKSLLKHRVSKILLQTINQNTAHDYKHDAINKSTQKQSNNTTPSNYSTTFSSLCEAGDTEELRNYIINRTLIVSNQRKAAQIITEIMSAGEPVSLDFEGVNLGNDGIITLVQLGTIRGSVYIFDVLTQPSLLVEGKGVLGGFLTDPGVVKVMHDCRNDSVNLWRQFGVRIAGVFDTQVGHIVVSGMMGGGSEVVEEEVEKGKGQQRGSSSKNISLNNLCSLYGGVCNPFKDKVKSVYRHDQKYWSRRPLTKQMIAYASCDVMCLVPGIYETIKSKIESDPESLELFRQLCEEQVLTHIQPDEIRSRRRLRKNEADLKCLRGKLDKAFGGGSSNSNLVLSNREMRLLKHLNLTEEEKERLKLSLKVAKKLEKMSCCSSNNTLSNPSSLCNNNEGLSSDSTSNSELASLEYPTSSVQDSSSGSLDPRIAQIDSLEAIINRLISDGGGGGDVDEGERGRGKRVVRSDDEEEEEEDVEEFDCYEDDSIGLGKPEFMIGGGVSKLVGGVKKEISTQTVSTGDIVITKVFDD